MCGDENADPLWRCIDQTCVQPACAFTIDSESNPVYACPNDDDLLVDVSIDCANECPGADEGLEFHEAAEETNLPFVEIDGGVLCSEETGTVELDLANAPFGEYTVVVGATGPGGSKCWEPLTLIIGDAGLAVESFGIEVSLDPSPEIAPLPDRINVCIGGEYIRRIGTQPIDVYAEFIDCDDNVILVNGQSHVEFATIDTYADPYTSLPGGMCVVYELDCGDPPGQVVYPASVRIYATHECASVRWEGLMGEADVPPPQPDCPITEADLACFACEEEVELEESMIQFYKSVKTVYTACSSQANGSSYGEVVNGELAVPGEGLLFVSHTGLEGKASLYGQAAPDGWYRPTGQTGERITDPACASFGTESEQQYRFNVVGESCACAAPSDGGNPTVTFHWYEWEAESCCFRRSKGALELRVLPLEVEKTAFDPVVPKRDNWKKSDDSYDYELRLPWCGGCAPDHPSDGNLSLPFMAWPTPLGQEIQHGHAKGWTITAGALMSPKPDSAIYQFESVPSGP